MHGQSQLCAWEDCVFLRVAVFEVKSGQLLILRIAHYDHFSPTYHVPSGTSRAKAGSVSSDPFGRKLRHGRSRERRSQRGRHHAKGTRYVGEIGFIAAMLAPLASSRPCITATALRKTAGVGAGVGSASSSQPLTHTTVNVW